MRISDWSSDVCSSDLQAYSIQPTPSRIGTLNASVNALITQFGAIRDGIGSGNLPDGTAAAPALRFGADADTGLWRPSANAIAWSTAGVERMRSEEHTSELQSLMRMSYAVFCLQNKKQTNTGDMRTRKN